MKKLKVAVLMCIFSLFALCTIQAQAEVLKGGTWYWGAYSTDNSQIVETPSGNLLIKLVWQLNEDDPRVPEKGVNKISVNAIYYFDGVWVYPKDMKMIITADGKGVSIYHINGAGSVTPPDKK
jgi:hypothetical protein